MKIKGLAKLTGEAIEQTAERFITYYNRSGLRNLLPTNLMDVARFLNEKHGFIFDFDMIIGFAEDGTKILGAFNPKKKIILVDKSLQSDGDKFNFTLAHEIGHLILHRKLTIVYEFPGEIIGANSIEFKEDNHTDADWMEWQANRFGAALLMPKPIFAAKLLQAKQKMNNTSRPYHLFVNDHPQSLSEYFLIIDDLSSFFGVSHTAVKIRLATLGMVTDYRSYSGKVQQLSNVIDWNDVSVDNPPF